MVHATAERVQLPKYETQYSYQERHQEVNYDFDVVETHSRILIKENAYQKAVKGEYFDRQLCNQLLNVKNEADLERPAKLNLRHHL